MKACFADTSYFLAMLISADVNHAVARRWGERNRVALTTTEHVIAEVGNHLSPIATRRLFSGFLRALRQDPRTTIVAASTELLDRGADLYGARLDKNWSLTDCISFVVMRDHGLTEALTADHHFEQAGFSAMLKRV